jgi:hypothetical protein
MAAHLFSDRSIFGIKYWWNSKRYGREPIIVRIGRKVWGACIFGRARNTIFWLGANFLTALGYLDCNLVALILSCITLKPHWKRKFAILVHTSIHTRLCFFRRPIFCSPRPPRSLSLCYHLRTLPHVDAIAPLIRMSTNAPPQGLYLYFFILDQWHTGTCRVFSSGGFGFIPFRSTTFTIVL